MTNITHDEAARLDKEYIMATYGRYDIAVSHGKGATLYDLDGRKWIDFTAGIGVNALGWCDEGWTKAVSAQLADFAHISNYFISPVTAKAAESLISLTGMTGAKVFFGNSGAEANEGAIKTARKYSRDKNGDGRSTIISLKSSFHGRTITTLAATGQDVFHVDFAPYTEGFKFVEMGDADALYAAITPDVCAIIAEPVQGEGGVNFMSGEYARLLRSICDEKELLLIFDEIQCGVGRTGSFFAYEQLGIKPDIVTLAKGLAGGLPIGAFICAEKCASVLGSGQHGSTFGGNPVSAAGACEIMKRVSQPEFLESVKVKGEYLADRIVKANIPKVKAVRYRGLMLGIAVEGSPKEAAHKCFDEGLLVLTAGKDVVRLLPPLNISENELEAGADILIKALKA